MPARQPSDGVVITLAVALNLLPDSKCRSTTLGRQRGDPAHLRWVHRHAVTCNDPMVAARHTNPRVKGRWLAETLRACSPNRG